MNKGGTGIGSASIVLIFAVLCLTVFAIIAYSSARAEKALADAEVRLVKEYYQADTLAEQILGAILEAETVPDTILGVEIDCYADLDTGAEIAEYSCVMTDKKELYVKLAIYQDYYDILCWNIQQSGAGQYESAEFGESGDSLPIWDGN